MEQLIYKTAPKVTLATNHFINVPIVLQYDDTPLISVIKEQELGYTSQISIFHPDGTYLAKVNGTRVYPTKAGEKAGLAMRYPEKMTVCEMGGKTVFEIFHESGNSFRTNAELYTPNGCFIKSHNAPISEIMNSKGNILQVGGVHMSGCSFSGCSIGIWLKSDGSCSIGVNNPK